MRISLLNERIAEIKATGWTVYSISSGVIAPSTKQSKLYKALAQCREAYPQAEVDYITGAKLQHETQGRHFAIIYKVENNS